MEPVELVELVVVEPEELEVLVELLELVVLVELDRVDPVDPVEPDVDVSEYGCIVVDAVSDLDVEGISQEGVPVPILTESCVLSVSPEILNANV